VGKKEELGIIHEFLLISIIFRGSSSMGFEL